jgi:ABC-type transport system substrate-binding protein
MFMKRFIPTIAILLPLFLFAACGPSKNPEANATAGSSAASAATITASPNPVTVGEGPATTTVTWNTGDGTAGQVYVSVDGGPEAVFAFGPSGSNAASWIQAGKTFEFRLYAGAEHTKVLAKTQVTARK